MKDILGRFQPRRIAVQAANGRAVSTGHAAGAATTPAPVIALPSGSEARLADIIRDVPGAAGTTWRYRFIVPDLARLVPAQDAPVTAELTPEDMAELDQLGLQSEAEGGPVVSAQALAEAELIAPEDLDLPDFSPQDFADRIDGDRQSELALDQPMAVPPEPDLLLLDPVHQDIAWLCEQWVLKQIPKDAPVPAQIIISLSDRPVEFGTIDMQAVQLFEAYSISPDRKSCIWEPW